MPRNKSAPVENEVNTMVHEENLVLKQSMYRLYRDKFCLREGIADPVSEGVYRNIFVTQYNLKFFVSKKDQCTLCNAYNKGTLDYKQTMQVSCNEHKAREKEAHDCKEADKKRAAEDKSFKAITFDQQAVLYTPCSGDCQIFYKRKLAVYNFTTHEGDTKNGFCYLWDETEGRRGSLEISTSLIMYIRGLPQSITHVSSFSDTCAGQNRNKYICAAMMYAVQTIPNLLTIDLKFMEFRHSYLDADSMHSTIENVRKHHSI